jgi:hypothetical protein
MIASSFSKCAGQVYLNIAENPNKATRSQEGVGLIEAAPPKTIL